MNTRVLLTVLGIGLLVLVGIGGVLSWYALRSQTRQDINVAGGRVLVYETAQPLPSSTSLEELAAAVRRRLGADRRSGLTVQGQEGSRLEIAIAGQGASLRDEVETVKELLAWQGRLELRILTNPVDDAVVLDAVGKYLAGARDDTRLRHELEERARAGLPPLLPSPPGGAAAWPEGVAYSWVELGQPVLLKMNLDDAAEFDRSRNERWREVAAARDRGETVLIPGHTLIFSRACRNEMLGPGPRAAKKYEYFVLSRDPDPDRTVTAEHVARARAGTDTQAEPAVLIGFTKEGADRLHELTSRYVPPRSERAPVHRQLAIVVDGLVLAAPTITGPSRTQLMIPALQTPFQAEQLATVLQTGPLPVRLRPEPVSDTVVEPAK